jgi:hypothetical protein
MSGDVIGAADEELDGEWLLLPAMRAGEPIHSESLEEMTRRSRAQLTALPPPLREPSEEADATPYQVTYSERLRASTR